MIYEERCYTLQPAHFRRFLAVFEAEGLDMILEHLGQLVGYFATETGTLNTVVHIWAYEDLADREQRRNALWNDPRWQAYAEKVMPWIEHMESRLLKPTRCSPLQ